MRAHTTGSFAVFSKHDGGDVTPRGRKARALLAYLISHSGAKIPKSRIVGLLWAGRGDAQARSSMRQALLELRVSINVFHEIIFSDREHIWIRSDALVEDPADVVGGHKDAFEDLDGISAEFDDWLAGERGRRAKARTAKLRAEAENLLADERWEDSLALVEQMQAIDPHDEDALRLGMEAEFQCGRAGAMIERYRATAALLSGDLGVLPSHETRALRDELVRRLTATQQAQPLRESDQQYFVRRSGEERAMARQAETEVGRKLHETLAERYDELADGLL